MEKIQAISLQVILQKSTALAPLLLPNPKMVAEELKKAERLLNASPSISEAGIERAYVKRSIANSWVAPLGRSLDLFESRLASMAGSKYALAAASSGAALHLAVRSVGIQTGDIVFMQSLTSAATVNSVLLEGGVPLLIDLERDTGNMDPQLLEEAFVQHEPKAVIVTHLFGNSAKIAEIQALCVKYHTPLIEDATESLGVHHQGKWTGTFGDYGVYSFNGNATKPAFDSGMLISNHKKSMKHAIQLAREAKNAAEFFQHSLVGISYQLSNMMADIILAYLNDLGHQIAKKRTIYQTYQKGFEAFKNITLIPSQEGSTNWMSVMLIDSDTVTPLVIIKALAAEHIEAHMIREPIHLQPSGRDFTFIDTGVAEDFFNRGICLPSNTQMTEDEQSRTIEIIKQLIK